MATNGGSAGTYYLGGTGALTVAQGNYNSLDIGQRGTGNFYVSQGGALTNSGSALIIGQAYGGSNGATNGTLIQQGGTVTANNGVSLGAQANGNNASNISAGIYYPQRRDPDHDGAHTRKQHLRPGQHLHLRRRNAEVQCRLRGRSGDSDRKCIHDEDQLRRRDH